MAFTLAISSYATVNVSPCSSSFSKICCAAAATPCQTGITCQYQTAEWACPCKDHPYPSHPLSCIFLLLIASVIALAGMAEKNNPLGSRRLLTDDAADHLLHVAVRDKFANLTI